MLAPLETAEGLGVEGFDPIGPRADVLTLVLGVVTLPGCALLSVSSLPDEVYEVGLEFTLVSMIAQRYPERTRRC